MGSVGITIPQEMLDRLHEATEAVRNSKKTLAFSHIDADGITALAIVVRFLEREGVETEWKNVHQINSESILDVRDTVMEARPDLVVFSDFGTGQLGLIQTHIAPIKSVRRIIILDHHLPKKNHGEGRPREKIIEINPCNHGLSGSADVSGAGVAFLLAIHLSLENTDLSELAVVGASGDLQDFYGRGFKGINADIIKLGEKAGYVSVDKDLTFFGINTRPLPFLLEYATEPYLPGLTGNRDACYAFFENLRIPMKNSDDTWRTWSDLHDEEKQRAIQGLFHEILQAYDNPRIAKGIVGDVISLLHRPLKSEMRNVKEFSTLLNACGRNREPEVGVRICLGHEEAYTRGKTLLQTHRSNLAQALRRIEEHRYDERRGMYLIDDNETPDTIIGIVIGMAQGARLVPVDKPVIGVSRNTTGEGPTIKLSGRARSFLIKKGLNLKEAFVEVAESLNKQYGETVAEAGGHPMAAGAFVHEIHLEEFLDMTSDRLAKMLAQ
ncbi:DHH family phosphoesterase [Candidatus Thorarchaeota archaeon]|jgi:RecJ-like exonuclease|nr:MAG: DHH family phosphoesterase [Candidatus Thorarchaeota archaeon]